jgi:hypothetical protein
MSPVLETKDPTDVKDYAIDWADVLSGESDTISTSSWGASDPLGLTIAAVPPPSISGTKAIVWVSGGVTGAKHVLANTITTAGGRTHQRSITIPCFER